MVTAPSKPRPPAWKRAELALEQLKAEALVNDTATLRLPDRDRHGPLRYHALLVQFWTETAFERDYDYIHDAGWIKAISFPYAYRHVKQDEQGTTVVSLTCMEARKLIEKEGLA